MGKYIGIGKIEFMPLSENAYRLAPHHFIIIKTKETMEFLDAECGLTEGFILKESNNLTESINAAIERLAQMIVDHAEINIREYGLEHYGKIINTDFTRENLELYDKIKKQIDPNKTKKGISSSKFKEYKNMESSSKFSFRNVA